MEHQQDQLKKELKSIKIAALYIDQDPVLRALREELMDSYLDDKIALGRIGASEIIYSVAKFFARIDLV